MVFQDPILAGATLVRDGIQSEGYVAGSVGWRINRDGSAEFNSGTFRGALLVNNPGGTGYVQIAVNQATGVPQIFLVPETVSGVTVSGASILTQPPSGAPNNGNTGPSFIASGPSQDGLGRASIELRGQGKVENSRITLAANDVASAPILFRNPDGTIETWRPIVFANGWANQGTSTAPGQPAPFRAVLAAAPVRHVAISGVLNGPANGGLSVGNVLAAYAPKYRQPVMCYASPASGTPMLIIEPSGAITPVGIGATASVWVSGVYPLD